MRVAFTLIGGRHWIGGTNYLINLLSALQEANSKIRPILFTGNNIADAQWKELEPYFYDSVRSPWWDDGGRRSIRTLGSIVLQKDMMAERLFRDQRIDAVFQHSAWYGFRFSLPTIAWIADFQHRRLPQMFSSANRWKREIGYKALSFAATTIIVSSEAAKRDCLQYYPATADRIEVLPFAVRCSGDAGLDRESVLEKYDLPAKFFFLPNQFWKHKNHLAVVRALGITNRQHNTGIVIVSCGSQEDHRNPDYPHSVLDAVREAGLSDSFRALGVIPVGELIALMKCSAALLNPSLFEGWSTTVEEAKTFGVPMILSRIPVHLEQAPGASFFDPYGPDDIAKVLMERWQSLPAGPRPDCELIAADRSKVRRLAFARRFEDIVSSTLTRHSRG